MSVDLTFDVGARVGYARATAEGRRLVQQRMEQIRIEVREFVLLSWPVDTATSLQGWEIRVQRGLLIIRNQIPYAVHVHRGGETTLVWEEIEAVAEQAVADAEAEMRQIVAENTAGATTRPLQVGGVSAVMSALIRARERVLRRLTRDQIRGQIRDVRDPTKRRPLTLQEVLRG